MNEDFEAAVSAIIEAVRSNPNVSPSLFITDETTPQFILVERGRQSDFYLEGGIKVRYLTTLFSWRNDEMVDDETLIEQIKNAVCPNGVCYGFECCSGVAIFDCV